MRRAAALLVLVVLAGCGGGGTKPVAAPPKPAPTTASPTPTPKPTPTILSKYQAGRAYLHLVAPLNRALTVENKIADHSPVDLAAFRRQAKVIKVRVRTFATGLRTTLWPRAVRPTALKMADDEAAEVVLWADAAAATTFAQADQAWTEIVDDRRFSADAELMRELLGLPSLS